MAEVQCQESFLMLYLLFLHTKQYIKSEGEGIDKNIIFKNYEQNKHTDDFNAM